jgi:hypothetical protein
MLDIIFFNTDSSEKVDFISRKEALMENTTSFIAWESFGSPKLGSFTSSSEKINLVNDLKEKNLSPKP